MKTILAATAMGAMSAIATAPAGAEGIDIRPNSGAKSSLGETPENFTGHAVITPLLPPNETTRANAGLVTFAPGARTTWHTHPAGQLLFITSGQGWVQEEGKGRRAVNAGNTVWIAPGVKHWHGATATTSMTHIAMTYVVDGRNVTWLEPVSDEQYR